MEKAMPAPPKVVSIAAAPPVKGGPTFTDRAADKSSNFREDGHFYPLSVVLSAAVDRSNKQRMSSAYTRNAYLRINLGWSLWVVDSCHSPPRRLHWKRRPSEPSIQLRLSGAFPHTSQGH